MSEVSKGPPCDADADADADWGPHPESDLDLENAFRLEHHGPDTYLGESPPYSWGRIYGGLVVAQALWAATLTVRE